MGPASAAVTPATAAGPAVSGGYTGYCGTSNDSAETGEKAVSGPEAGGNALAVQCDLRDDAQIADLVDKTVAWTGGIDILINNASAIDNSGTLSVAPKKYDLMHGINGRGTFMMTQAALPHLQKGTNPHVLNMSPPLDLDPRWFKIGGVS